MPARKLYDDFYEDGSAAKKRELRVEPEKNKSTNKRHGKNKLNNQKSKAKKNASLVAFILCGFAMTMVITYRYNMISEKNFESQNLKSKLAAVEASVLNKQIEVEQGTDLNKIEAYAKQQLGMQKPDKNQTIYVDTSKGVQAVETSEDTTVLEKAINAVKNFINSIF